MTNVESRQTLLNKAKLLKENRDYRNVFVQRYLTFSQCKELITGRKGWTQGYLLGVSCW